MDRLRRHYADGYTVILNNVQDYAPWVARLVQSIQARTSYPVEANAYMTPPKSQGFKPHYDTHDVLVAQVEGEKLWRVYGAEAACPLPELTDGAPVRREGLPTPEHIRLVPGDVLYIPRGWIHEAESEKGSSLHLTFGIHAPQGRDLIRASIDALCRVHPELRSVLPFGYLRRPTDQEALKGVLARLIALLQADGSAKAALVLLEDDFIRRGESIGNGEFVATVDALPSLTADTKVERKQHLHARILSLDSGVALQFSQTLVQGPKTFGQAFEFVLDRDLPFRLGDLPGLDPDQQLALGTTLLSDGFLRLSSVQSEDLKFGCQGASDHSGETSPVSQRCD
jgi:bifunctional lysine-specific demethylase and histidyl-hydroxylase NO66